MPLSRKFAIPAIVSGCALLCVLGWTLFAARGIATGLDALERGHYPAVLFSRRLIGELETLQLTLRDAVATEDEAAIDATKGLSDQFLERIASERTNASLSSEALDTLERAFGSYYELAVASSREMLVGEFDVALTAKLTQLKQLHDELTGDLTAQAANADAEMRDVLESVRRQHALMTFATGGLLLLSAALIAWIGREIVRDALEPLLALRTAADAVAAGKLAEDAPGAQILVAKRHDEFGDVLLGFAAMRDNLRDLVSRAHLAAAGVAETSASLVGVQGELRTVSDDQAMAVASVERALLTVTTGIGSIRGGLRRLSEFGETTSTSLRELDATIAEADTAIEGNAGTVKRVSDATLSLAANSRQVAQNATELQSAAELTESAVTTWIGLSREVEERATETLSLARIVDERSLDGHSKATTAGSNMVAIRSSFEGVSRSVASLVDRAASVGEINNVIEGIADETSLLALNAAIVSAQAGVHGRVFAVVSDAIRDLAKRTAESTREIRAALDGLHQDATLAMASVEANSAAIEQGSSLSTDVALALDEIGSNAKRCLDNMIRVGESAKRQEDSRESVRSAVSRVRRVVAELDAGATDQANASQELRVAMDSILAFMHQIQRASASQRSESKSINAGAALLTGQIEHMVSAVEEQSASGQEILRSLDTFRAVREQSEAIEKGIGDGVNDLSSRAAELNRSLERFSV